MHRRVINDGAAHFAAHKVLDVLSNGSKTKIIFTGTLGERKEEISGIFVLHELPGLIDNKKAALLLGADDIPNVGEDDIHSNRAELILEVANIKDDHAIINIDIRLLREDASKSTGSVFTEALREGGAGAAHVDESIIEITDGRRSGLMSEGIGSNTSTSISVDQGLVEVGFLGGGKTETAITEHETEKAVKGDEVGTEGVISVLRVDHLWQIKWINTDIGIKAEADIRTADGITEFLIFVLGVDDDNFGAKHHRAQGLKLNSERFTSTRLCENDEVGIL